MKCILMNKDCKVALIEFNTQFIGIEKIYEIYNIEALPLRIKNALSDKSKNATKELNRWFKGRGIPSWRKDLKRLLDNLHIESTDELLDKAYGLSLSDQYWFKEKNDSIEWKDINFFDHDFEYMGFMTASFSSSAQESSYNQQSLISPNNTTDGMLQKAWIIENGKRYLIKGTYTSSRQEPLNEWLASTICDRLGFNHCHYELAFYNKTLVSKCKNFIKANEEIIPACDLFESVKKNNNTNDFEHYIHILEKIGIKNARNELENMFILDYLIMNEDRHLRNFGAIRNVETLKYEKLTPIFDTGQSMQCSKITSEMNFYDGYGKFFYNTNKKFSDYLNYISNLSRFDLSLLGNIVEEYKNLLYKYQETMDMSETRIEKLVNGLDYRINHLKEIIG